MSTLSTHKNRKTDTRPFDRFRVPPKQNAFFMPVVWLWSLLATRKGRLRINRVGMKGLKPPYLVLGTHQAWSDFYVTPLALFPHRANYISELEGFEVFGEWIYRQVGCLGTRKFISDTALVRNIKRVIDRKGILVIYPEARYANVGTSSVLPDSVGKLAKRLGVPVVTINMHGNYLQSPIWNTAVRKEAVQETTITRIFTAEELSAASVDEVNDRISEFLRYDEYEWQYENKYAITFSKRAEGLHLALYRCPECDTEFEMSSEGADIFCKHCGARWRMSAYGRLLRITDAVPAPDIFTVRQSDEPFSRIPDWYERQRQCVIDDIDRGTYALDTEVHIEALPNAVNFIDMGEGRLLHGREGFTLVFADGSGQEPLHFPPISTFSVHTEYNYRNRGQCITLSTLDNTYFLFPRGEGFNATKIQFAAERMYELAKAEISQAPARR